MSLESATYLDGLIPTNPVAGDNVSQGDDHLRLLKDVLKNTFPGLEREIYFEKAIADLASSSTPDLSSVASNYINITGTTQINGFATEPAGFVRVLRFNDALTLNYNVTSFSLPSADDIVTASGDHCIAVSLGSGNWRIHSYCRGNGRALIEPEIPDIEELEGIGWGRHTIYLPASAFVKPTAEGRVPVQYSAATSGLQVFRLEFPATGVSYADAQLHLPISWNEGNLKLQFEWMTDSADTNAVKWNAQCSNFSDGSSITTNFSSVATVTDAAQSSVSEILITGETGNLAVLNANGGDMCMLRVYRDPSDGSDTSSGSAWLVGVRIFYDINKVNDATS